MLSTTLRALEEKITLNLVARDDVKQRLFQLRRFVDVEADMALHSVHTEMSTYSPYDILKPSSSLKTVEDHIEDEVVRRMPRISQAVNIIFETDDILAFSLRVDRTTAVIECMKKLRLKLEEHYGVFEG